MVLEYIQQDLPECVFFNMLDLLNVLNLLDYTLWKVHKIIFCFLAVHNVKPECLDAYNELW